MPTPFAMASNPWLAGVNVSKCPVCDVRLLNGSCIDHGPPEDPKKPAEPEKQPDPKEPAELEKQPDPKEPVEPEKLPEELGEDDRSQFTDFQNYFLNIHTLFKRTSKQPEEKPEDKLEEKPEDKLEEKPEDKLEENPDDKSEEKLEEKLEESQKKRRRK